MAGRFHDIDSYLRLPRAPERWIVEDILPTGGKLALFAPPKTGKSWVALQIAMDVASGKDSTLSFPVRSHGPALYLQLDTPRSLWIEEYLLHLRNNLRESLRGVHFADREEIPSYPFDARFHAHMEWLRDAVASINPAMIVVDTWREAFRGNENDNDTAQDVLSSLAGAAGNAALIIVSHVSKAPQLPDAPKRSLVDMLRGSTYLAGAVDGLMLVGEKNLTYKSRTVMESQVRLDRDSEGAWMVPHVDVESYIQRVLEDDKLLTLGARIRRLAEVTGRPEAYAKEEMRKYLG